MQVFIQIFASSQFHDTYVNVMPEMKTFAFSYDTWTICLFSFLV